MQDWQKLAVLELHKDGRSVRDISSYLNIPKSTVHDFIKEKYDSESALLQRILRQGGTQRVMVISDTHAGSRVGLTPPGWMFRKGETFKLSEQRGYISEMQEEMWDWFTKTTSDVGPVDILIHVGDAIDGKAGKDKSTDLITASLIEQVEIAEEVIDVIDYRSAYMVYGTPYHTAGDGEDFESILARNIGAVIDGRLWVEVNGITFDVRHHIGSSSTPSGRATSISKEWVWNTFWKEKGMQPKSDIFLRGHIHYHTEVSGLDFKAMSCPSLQGPKTKFGERRCSGTVDFGFIVFDIPQNSGLQDVEYKVYSKNLETFKPIVYTHNL